MGVKQQKRKFGISSTPEGCQFHCKGSRLPSILKCVWLGLAVILHSCTVIECKQLNIIVCTPMYNPEYLAVQSQLDVAMAIVKTIQKKG